MGSRRVWLSAVFAAAAACGGTGADPTVGSGSPAVVVARRLDAGAVDARGVAAADAELGAGPGDLSAAQAAAGTLLPEHGFELALLTHEQLAWVIVDRMGVRATTVMAAAGAQMRWVDPRTLVVLSRPPENDKPIVSHVVAAAVAGSSELDAVWSSPTAMLVTKSGEVWLERCPSETRPCTAAQYVRAWPAPHERASKAPHDPDEALGASATEHLMLTRGSATVTADFAGDPSSGVDGTWVFRVGTTEVGRLTGGELRAAPEPPGR